jgi:hypothetical protein
MVYQLPVSSARWQHGCQIYLETFSYLKIRKITNNATATEAKEKSMDRFGILNI